LSKNLNKDNKDNKDKGYATTSKNKT
jgi:hypothetical protein